MDEKNDIVDVKISSTEKFVVFGHKSSSTKETKGEVYIIYLWLL